MSASPLHFVLADFGKLGQSWVERDPKDMDRKTTVRDIKYGQIENVRRILCVDADTLETRDVTAEVLREVSEWHGIETRPIEIFGRTRILASDNEGYSGYGMTEAEAIAKCLEDREVA